MSEFDQFLEFQRDIAEATLKIIDKYKGEEPPKK